MSFAPLASGCLWIQLSIPSLRHLLRDSDAEDRTVKFRNFFLGDLPLLEARSLLRGSMVPLPRSAVPRFPVSLYPLTNEPVSLMKSVAALGFTTLTSLTWNLSKS